MKFLITYDIKSPKRWKKVFGYIKKKGLNIQLSCFEVEMSDYMIGKLLEELSKFIDLKEDVIYTYPLEPNSSAFSVKLGKAEDLNKDYVL
ncbi:MULTISPECIES: CRISPR-associated endonuclease Cas2 [Desulfurella]|jgi:CRISPR-associated protein Cas2|uniref:CRISPR-associated endoribonuclease Cas2 n=1 Tax=Desulfurella multipotens TaxID=79269 RepID=A0A1G6M7P2_9BACT|nr:MULTISPECIES: CRISPR-associated endonuclease Cas2 [Desulfurella]PMP67235.1 MAG: CRISPR-associated endonuclease Cas2 [Desulfurella multipotens]PMP93553.1 MAG: CRISPR-associated endonuclease Cas2 [Desulfurella sp.]SDC51324.1 CRISPR-associated protein Cas2 [Desulfurella multipotens]